MCTAAIILFLVAGATHYGAPFLKVFTPPLPKRKKKPLLISSYKHMVFYYFRHIRISKVNDITVWDGIMILTSPLILARDSETESYKRNFFEKRNPVATFSLPSCKIHQLN